MKIITLEIYVKALDNTYQHLYDMYSMYQHSLIPCSYEKQGDSMLHVDNAVLM